MNAPVLPPNFLGAPTYWRDYPDRDIEFVRWYPCDVRRLDAKTMLDKPRPAAVAARDIGFYLHVPFCNQICTSCPYNKFNTRNTLVARYLEALKREIDLYADHPHFRDATVTSGYLGGGTPTTLRAEELDDLLSYLRARWRLRDPCRITVETTPADIDPEKIAVLKKHGVDRVSIGMQTFHDPLLRHLGRARSHTRERGIETLHMLRREGIESVCIDLMIGIPGQTMALWREDVERLMDLPVNSFSIYNYMVLPGTEAFFRIQHHQMPPPPSAEEAAEMYWWFVDRVMRAGHVAVTVNDFFGGDMARAWTDKGIATWDIPNPAGAPFRGLDTTSHDLIEHLAHAWYEGGEMIALGAGAYGFVNDHLYLTEPDIDRYIASCTEGRLPVRMGAATTAEERMRRSMVLGLKLLRYRRADFRRLHGVDMIEAFPAEIGWLLREGLATLDDEAVALTYPKGWFYMDNISKAFYSPANKKLPQPTSSSTEILHWLTPSPQG
jgi:oxygen-independent coproporphyrinogen-3 oxidase